MTVTGIERQKRRPQRVNIFIDGKFAVGVHESALLKSRLRVGDTVDARDLDGLKKTEEFQSAKDKALRLIGYRLRSEKELRTRLAQKAFESDVIEQVLKNLREAGMVNDATFAKAFAHDLIARKSAGRSLIERELRTRGIAKAIISDTVAENSDSGEEEARALKSAELQLKKYRQSRKKTDVRTQQQRIISFLGRRGFDFAIIRAVTKKLFSTDISSEL